MGRLGDTRDNSTKILFKSFLREAIVSKQFWHGQGCPLFDVIHPAFPPPTTASPRPDPQGALKDGSGEAVVARDIYAAKSKEAYSLAAD